MLNQALKSNLSQSSKDIVLKYYYELYLSKRIKVSHINCIKNTSKSKLCVYLNVYIVFWGLRDLLTWPIIACNILSFSDYWNHFKNDDAACNLQGN